MIKYQEYQRAVMKGSYGYLVTLTVFIVGTVLMFALAGQNQGVNENLLVLLLIVMFTSGIAGGFVAPYHIKDNTLKSMGTMIGLGTVIVGILYFFFNDLVSNGGSGDPLGDLVIGIFLVIFMVVIGLLFLAGTVAIGLGGLIGAVFGRMFFTREQYEDLGYVDNDYGGYPVK